MKRPMMYVLDYGSNHLGNPEYIKQVSVSPPELLHLGKDVPFTHSWGPIRALGGENQAFGKGEHITRLRLAEVRERIGGLKELTENLHKVGVKYLAPYICAMTVGGDDEKRTGFWEFFDHWDEYTEFGLGEKSSVDPIDWMQRQPSGELQCFYPYSPPYYEPNHRLAACPNSPDWRNWLSHVVRLIAECGYDGVFVDNNSVRCYCVHCQSKFKGYLAGRYSKDELARYFGFDDVESIKLAEERSGLLWVETQRFWWTSIRKLWETLGAAGRKVREPFLIFPNFGRIPPFQTVQNSCDVMMFERGYGTHPGMLKTQTEESVGFDTPSATQPKGLRVNAFVKDKPESLVLHLVNYNVPLGREGNESPIAISDLLIELPLPDGWQASKIQSFEPETAGSQEIEFVSSGGILRFTVPSVKIYKICCILAD